MLPQAAPLELQFLQTPHNRAPPNSSTATHGASARADDDPAETLLPPVTDYGGLPDALFQEFLRTHGPTRRRNTIHYSPAKPHSRSHRDKCHTQAHSQPIYEDLQMKELKLGPETLAKQPAQP
jgi:hypothetical protein